MLVLCGRLRRTNEQVEDLAFLDLPSRMAKALLRLMTESGVDPVRPVVRISQRALGELVGGSRESVNKNLQAWKELGIISLEKKAIMIRNVTALLERAQ
jgi:CRP-like cAMP-binding protein